MSEIEKEEQIIYLQNTDAINKETQIEKLSKKTNYYLYNILTDELNKVECTLLSLTEIVKILFKEKYEKNNISNDEDFMDKIQEIADKHGLLVFEDAAQEEMDWADYLFDGFKGETEENTGMLGLNAEILKRYMKNRK
jgi:hypothetical protein